MKGYLKRLFWLTPVRPVTVDEATAAPRPAEKEAEIKEARARFVGELMGVERRAFDIRHDLAGSALKIVAGD
jgi:hypothetical protein